MSVLTEPCHSLTALMLRLYQVRWSKATQHSGAEFNEGFQSYLFCDRALRQEERIDLWPILPLCPNREDAGVAWCEAREWEIKGESQPWVRSFCPRVKNACATQYAEERLSDSQAFSRFKLSTFVSGVLAYIQT